MLRVVLMYGQDPDKLNTIDQNTAGNYGTPQTYAQENYKAYDRTFAQPPAANPAVPATGTPFAWFKNPAMTAEETKKAYADAGKAFTAALKAQSQKPLFGILVPNPAPPTAATPAAVAKPAAAAAVATDPPAAPAAVDTSPVSIPVPDRADTPSGNLGDLGKTTRKTTRAAAADAPTAGKNSSSDRGSAPARRGSR